MRGGRMTSTRTRQRLFRVLSLAIPVAFFALLEGGLRVAGFGGSYPLFVDVSGAPGYRQANPEVIRRYLDAAGGIAATIEAIPFPHPKPEGRLRIVVQGGSTAAGFPYGRWGGLAGMLADRLEAAFPEREIDVITTAMAAVNSYTLVDLADEILAVQPDLVLVYAGHNEYLGLLGVGSALTLERSGTSTRLYLALRRLRTFQAVHRGIEALRYWLAPAELKERDTLFAAAATGSLIPYGSDGYHQGLWQLERNLGTLLERYREAGVPVYIGTLVSNDRDQPPFRSEPAEPEAERSAAWWFARAQRAEAAGRLADARSAYGEARDRDLLRFRAPRAFEGVIRERAAASDARVVEVARRFEAESPGGIVGESLMLEHVHPNALGYFVLADAFLEALRADGRLGDWTGAPSRERALADSPISAVDRRLAAYDVARLRSSPPFREHSLPFELPPARDEIDRIARLRMEGGLDWRGGQDALMKHYLARGDRERAAAVARTVAQAYPFEPEPSLVTGRLYLALGEPRRARRHLARAFDLRPDDDEAFLALTRADFDLGDAEAARRHLLRFSEEAPQHPAAWRVYRQLVRHAEGVAASPARPEAP